VTNSNPENEDESKGKDEKAEKPEKPAKPDKPEVEYSASSIDVLEGLEAVRKRPGMYIGSTGPRGLHHLVWEIVDNSVDEALAGHCDTIEVAINGDSSVTVRDNGRGIPVGIVAKSGKSGVETVFTILHAGGKFGGEGGYKVSGGLHGVGASVVNALSRRLEVEVYIDKKIHKQAYNRGEADGGLEVTGTTELRGTQVTFWPDDEIFHDYNEENERVKIDFDWDTLNHRLREMAFLNKGLRMIVMDNRIKMGEEPKRAEYHYEGGISSYVEYINDTREAIHKPPIYVEQQREHVLVECAAQWTTVFMESVNSYVNNINTHDGGTHLAGFKIALTRVINDYARRTNLVKETDQNFTGEDVREGMTAIVSVKVPEPQFEGQTKERLGNREVQGIVQSIVTEALNDWLELNPIAAKAIVGKAMLAKKSREEAAKARNLVRRASNLEGSSLPDKLSDCSDKDPTKCEVYLVEGDSAGGSAKQGRDRTFQAILPLRGKILNVERVQPSRIYENAEVQAMISALGLVVKEEDDEGGGKKGGILRPNAENLDLEKLRYHKVIIMTDADVDGSHIRTLILTFFFRYARQLVEKGYVYIAQPPLFKVSKGKRTEYCFNEHKLEAVLAEMGEKAEIQRFKGLGEMMPQQLWDTTMNPETRILKKVTVDDASEADHIFDLLMGEAVAPRREFIEKNAHFARLDV
jgi:DNA gyrase subunit B